MAALLIGIAVVSMVLIVAMSFKRVGRTARGGSGGDGGERVGDSDSGGDGD
jgi:hypothetical protein